MPITKRKVQQRILILTSSGGVGHLQAAKAKKQEFLEQDPNCFILVKDIFVDIVGKQIGSFFTGLWNNAKAKSNIKALKALIYMQPIADTALFYPIYFALLKLLKTHKITHIIDTQNMGLSAILKALQKANHNNYQTIEYEKILTDLPTKNSTHYFKPIKKLSLNKRKGVKIVSTKPLLDNVDSDEAFWQKTCGLSRQNITYKPFPLRKSFTTPCSKDSSATMIITAKIDNKATNDLVYNTASFGSTHIVKRTRALEIHIPRQTKLTLLMLGGYPNKEAIVNYCNKFRTNIKKQDHLVCIFCNFGLENSQSLIQEIFTLVSRAKKFPKNLTILPLTYQDDPVITPLLRRSNATITRASGITCMELLTVTTGHCWIHQELHQDTKNISCMPIWEEGNTQYLQDKINAKLITADTFETITKGFFQ